MTSEPSTGLSTPVPDHDYTSTACQHGHHDRCRLTCKFCATPCRCTGHETTTEGDES